MSIPNSVNYAIIRKKYINIKSNTPKKQRRAAIDELNTKMNQLKKTTGVCYFEDERVLILWDGVKDEKKLTERFGLSNDYLISNFCSEIRECGFTPTKLYISSPKDLREPDDETPYVILQRLLNIWKESAIIPIFMEHNFLEMQAKEALPEMAKPVRKDMDSKSSVLKRIYQMIDEVEEEALTDEQVFKMDYAYFCRFFTSIEKLLAINEAKEEAARCPYVELYFKWQADEISAEKAVDEYIRIKEEQDPEILKAGMSVQTWYRRKDEFEITPYYPEYANAHRRFLILDNVYQMEKNPDYGRDGYIKKKAGKFPGAEPFLREYKEAVEEFMKSGGTGISPIQKMYEKFEEINSVIDVPRVYEAVKQQPDDLTMTGFMKHILEERNKKYGREEK